MAVEEAMDLPSDIIRDDDDSDDDGNIYTEVPRRKAQYSARS